MQMYKVSDYKGDLYLEFIDVFGDAHLVAREVGEAIEVSHNYLTEEGMNQLQKFINSVQKKRKWV